MPYAVVGELAPYLPQVDPVIQAAELASVIAKAEDIVNTFLGFSYADYGDTGTELTVRHPGGRYIKPPKHQAGSISKVTDYAGAEIPTTSWLETETGSVAAVDQYGNESFWMPGYYKVTAVYGHGPVPPSVVEVVLELCVNIWQGKQAGQFSDVVGVSGGGAVGYERALTQRQKMILSQQRSAAQAHPVAL